MQRANALIGKTQCRYCGQQMSIKALTAHILTRHTRPAQSLRPTLVKKTTSRPDMSPVPRPHEPTT